MIWSQRWMSTEMSTENNHDLADALWCNGWCYTTDRWWNLQHGRFFHPRRKEQNHRNTWNSRWISIFGSHAANPILVTDLDADGFGPTKLMWWHWGWKNVQHRWGLGKRLLLPILWWSVGGKTSFSEPFLCGKHSPTDKHALGFWDWHFVHIWGLLPVFGWRFKNYSSSRKTWLQWVVHPDVPERQCRHFPRKITSWWRVLTYIGTIN